MSGPTINVLGVYRLNVTDELVRDQCSLLYPEHGLSGVDQDAERQVRVQLSSVVLIETLVEERDDRFDISDFTQHHDGVDSGYWQAAWAEQYLTMDGTAVAVERWSPAPAVGDLRIAFFFHCWDPAKPLRSSYGEIICPQPQAMPVRLAELVPYDCVD